MENRNYKNETQRFVCVDCINNELVKKFVQKQNRRKKCNYCKEVRVATSISDLAEELKNTIERKYKISQFDGPSKINVDSNNVDVFEESDSNFQKKFFKYRELIQLLTGCSDQIVENIRNCIEFNYSDPNDPATRDLYTDKINYVETKKFDHKSEMLWIDLETSLVEESRFFNSNAKEFLDSIFGDISKQYFIDEVLEYVGLDYIQNYLYRARKFQSKVLLRKALKCDDYGLGPPPALQARAGRVNPHGISVFYGSYNAKVALTETRPLVGSFVLVGKFNIKKKLTLLNLNTLQKI